MRVPLLSQHWIKARTALVRMALGIIADDRGATAIEYTLITALIVMALVLLITQVGDFVSTPFDTVAAKL